MENYVKIKALGFIFVCKQNEILDFRVISFTKNLYNGFSEVLVPQRPLF